MKSNKEKGFTLAEVLITLAIIGVIAAIAVPSVISNSQQQEFKTGLRKAVSVLNSAITMNMALDGESPYDNANLMGFLMKHMAVISSTTDRDSVFMIQAHFSNAVFWTTDGMRFEFRRGGTVIETAPLYENPLIYACLANQVHGYSSSNTVYSACGGCGSYGLSSNSDGTTKPPCLITVDVNGDKKPNPANINCRDYACAKPYKFSDPSGLKLTDMFTLLITDKQAVPYGIAAQRAMYQAQK